MSAFHPPSDPLRCTPVVRPLYARTIRLIGENRNPWRDRKRRTRRRESLEDDAGSYPDVELSFEKAGRSGRCVIGNNPVYEKLEPKPRNSHNFSSIEKKISHLLFPSYIVLFSLSFLLLPNLDLSPTFNFFLNESREREREKPNCKISFQFPILAIVTSPDNFTCHFEKKK